MSRRRVVVTGMGMLTPVGVRVQESWTRILSGESGISSLKGLQFKRQTYAHLPSQVAGVIRNEMLVNHRRRVLQEQQELSSQLRKTSNGPLNNLATPITNLPPFIEYALLTTHEALIQAKWYHLPTEQRHNTGVFIGSGIGSLDEVFDAALAYSTTGLRKVSPHFVPRILVNMAAGHVAIRYQMLGPVSSPNGACATGAIAIAEAYHAILRGDTDISVAGATESSVSPISMAGFARARALSSSFNDNPQSASRPFDSKRDGFVIAEGCGVMVLESLDSVKRRNAEECIVAELVGTGTSSDGHHITAPREDGDGAYRALKAAVRSAARQMDVDESDVVNRIGYVNAHATGTPLGDTAEIKALERLFGGNNGPIGTKERLQKVSVSSTKGALGHSLGAAGAVEAILTCLALKEQQIPPTINLNDPLSTSLDLVAKSKHKPVSMAVNNSFGFGGINSCLIFKKWDG